VSVSVVPDHFKRLGFIPRPWLEQDDIKQRFLDLSAELHPDKASPHEKLRAEHDFQSLNESFIILRDTRSRLHHFLELSGFPKQDHVQDVPSAALAFFSEIATITTSADSLLREKSAAVSPILKVQFAEKSMEQLDAIQHLQQRLGAAVQQIESRLQSISAANPPDPLILRTLAGDAAALGFFNRWQAQLNDRIAALTF
jgi:curved DNA-binding protein CbpA